MSKVNVIMVKIHSPKSKENMKREAEKTDRKYKKLATFKHYWMFSRA